MRFRMVPKHKIWIAYCQAFLKAYVHNEIMFIGAAPIKMSNFSNWCKDKI